MRTVSFPQREPAYLVQAGAESALRAASELPQTNVGAIPAISGKSSWAVVFSANLGGTAGFFSLVPMMGQDFFYFRKGGRSDETEYQTMAGDVFPLIPIHNHHFDFRIGESL